MTLNQLLKGTHINIKNVPIQDLKWLKNKYYLLYHKAPKGSTWELMICKDIERKFNIDMNLADHPAFGGGGAGNEPNPEVDAIIKAENIAY